MEATIIWTKIGDGTPGLRSHMVAVDIPVTGPLSPEQEALLQIPYPLSGSYGRQIECVIGDPLSDLTQEIVIHALQIEADRRRAELDMGLTRLKAWATSGFPDPLEGLIEQMGDCRPSITGFADRCLAHAGAEKGASVKAAIRQLKGQWDEKSKFDREVKRKERARREKAEDAHSEKQADKKAARKAGRMAEIAIWAESYGSDRLKEQLAQGYEGWPLYLHERLAHEIPGAELDNDGDTGDAQKNPSEEALCEARSLAERLAALGLGDADEIVKDLDVAKITFEGAPDDPYDEGRSVLYVCAEGRWKGIWRPGPAEFFDVYRIRVEV